MHTLWASQSLAGTSHNLCNCMSGLLTIAPTFTGCAISHITTDTSWHTSQQGHPSVTHACSMCVAHTAMVPTSSCARGECFPAPSVRIRLDFLCLTAHFTGTHCLSATRQPRAWPCTPDERSQTTASITSNEKIKLHVSVNIMAFSLPVLTLPVCVLQKHHMHCHVPSRALLPIRLTANQPVP